MIVPSPSTPLLGGAGCNKIFGNYKMDDGIVDYLYPNNPRDTRHKLCLRIRKTE